MLTAYIAAIVYKCFGLLVGTSVTFMGFRLFGMGVFEKSDIEIVWKDRKMLLKRSAPGTVFALFGLAIICITALRSVSYNDAPLSALSDSAKAAMERVIENPDVPEADRSVLQNTIGPSANTISTRAFKVYRPAFPEISEKPYRAISRLLAGGAVTKDERIEALTWLADHMRDAPLDIRSNLISAVQGRMAFLDHDATAEVQKWLDSIRINSEEVAAGAPSIDPGAYVPDPARPGTGEH